MIGTILRKVTILFSNIVDLFEQQVKQSPGATALLYEDQILSYNELNQHANQLAHYLRREHQVSADTLVGIYQRRSLDMIISILGILKAGGAYLPLDPDYPKERISFMLEDSNPKLVLTHENLADSISKLEFPHVLHGQGLAITGKTKQAQSIKHD